MKHLLHEVALELWSGFAPGASVFGAPDPLRVLAPLTYVTQEHRLVVCFLVCGATGAKKQPMNRQGVSALPPRSSAGLTHSQPRVPGNKLGRAHLNRLEQVAQE